jgi:hypothetical protein
MSQPDSAPEPSIDSGPRWLHGASLLSLVFGCIVALALELYAGRNNQHLITQVGFVGWVLGPFVILAWAHMRSHAWSARMRLTLWSITVFIALVTVALYAHRIYRPPKAQPAGVFVITPVASVILIVIALSIAAAISPRKPRPS